MIRRLSKTALKGSAACIILVCSNVALAQARSIDIPAEDAGKSIPELARQTGVQIIAPGQALHGVLTPAVRGEYEVRVVLTSMLQGTDLRVASDDGRTIVLAQNQKNASAAANDSAVGAASPTVEQVVVTGSRVISDAANSPTPLTVVTAEQLAKTTPTDLPNALNKLPAFNGSVTVRNTTNAGSNATGAVLNLRNFGAQRTLILLDGHRVAPANANGTVDVDTLPQILVQRVDVVTGGASSVYGSDAVTGVVNFILDKNFEGIKLDVNGGLSNYADAASYNVGFAAGMDLFGGRGHFEMALRRFYQDGILQHQRTQGPQNWGLEGSGTAANPYADVIYTGNTLSGGRITCAGTTANPCMANQMRLGDGGLIVPYFIGTPTGTPNFTSRGDGGHTDDSQIISSLQDNESFLRLSYKFNDTITGYIQGSANESYTKGAFQNYSYTSGVTGIFFKKNPYLPAADVPLLAGGTSDTFSVAYLWNQGYPRDGEQSDGLNRNLSVTAGINGSLMGRFAWDVYYTHGENRLDEKGVNNENQQRMFAGEDAVVDTRPGLPTTGTVVCYVSTTQYASLYPGCVPANPFIKANYINEDYKNWVTAQTTYFHQTTILDDLGATISGDVFDLPAGPIRAALSAESRWQSFGIDSNASPTALVDCTGLRLCNANAAVWHNNVVASLATVSQNVWEFAGEAGVPVVKDLPLVQSLNLDLAGRYTNYSTSGAVETWKLGLDWHLNGSFRIRATNSVDIRAPTLNDLFSPISQGATSYNDMLTGTQGQLLTRSQGNPNLVPEVARTYTAGLVFTPDFLPGLTMSADYYSITLKNAISSVNGTTNSVQQICINSNATSPFCSLYIRPYGPSDPRYRAPANFPTYVLSESLNTAFNKVEGMDLEADYGFELSDIEESLPGFLNLRLLADIQPVNESLQYVGAPLTFLVGSPKGRTTGFLTYTLDSWSFALENRWYGNWTRATNIGIVYVNPRVATRDYLDVNITKSFGIGDWSMDGYLTIQNVANVQPPIAPTGGAVPGLFYLGSSPPGYDAVGRYFTLGVRAKL